MRVPDGSDALECVKAETEVPPSANVLSEAATGLVVFQTVPLAEIAAFPSLVMVAPKVALVFSIVETVGLINVGMTGEASPSPYRLMVQVPSSESELLMVTTATFEPPEVGVNRITKSSKSSAAMLDEGVLTNENSEESNPDKTTPTPSS